MRAIAALVFLGLSLPAAAPAEAQTAMSAAEFEAYVQGKTLYYSSQGSDYGAEQYLPGRRVIWTFLDGECADGFWYQKEELICFIYELDLSPQCWSFWKDGGGLAARFENDPEAPELYEARQSSEPLNCPGPGVGV